MWFNASALRHWGRLISDIDGHGDRGMDVFEKRQLNAPPSTDAEPPVAPRLTTPADNRREHFIPLRKADLIRLLARDPALGVRDREQFLSL